MARRVPHDRLFKELLGNFLFEFLQLFLPELAERIEPTSLVLMGEKELLLPGETTRRADLVARARVLGSQEDAFFLIHLEHEAQNKDPLGFPWRMLRYALYLRDSTGFDVYPIALLSYPSPKRQLTDRYELIGPDGYQVLLFQYRVIQLNRYRWRDFAQTPNPVAAALMSRMGIEPGERPLVKLACLRLLRKLNLGMDPSTLVASFFDHYLPLTAREEEKFQDEFSKISPKEQEEMIKLTTSWHEKGREEERARTEEERARAEEERARAERAERERDAERERAERERQTAEQERERAEREHQAVKRERERAERLAARLRELGVDPE